MKLGLGTVQFGLEYGVSNRIGRTSESEAAQIVATAEKHGVRVIDTASQYGSSEEVLGRILPVSHVFKIVTKTVRIDAPKITSSDVDRLEMGVLSSIERLGCSSVYGVLVHNFDDLLVNGGVRLIEKLRDLKHRNLLQKIGASVYDSEQIDLLLKHFDIDLIQLPVNIFDQRLITNGTLSKLKHRGIEIHARSAFLQGLLLMPLAEIPPFFSSVRQHLVNYHSTLKKLGFSLQEAALGFLETCEDIDAIVCGVNNNQQFLELCAAARPLPTSIDFSSFALTDETILNPTFWRIV